MRLIFGVIRYSVLRAAKFFFIEKRRSSDCLLSGTMKPMKQFYHDDGCSRLFRTSISNKLHSATYQKIVIFIFGIGQSTKKNNFLFCKHYRNNSKNRFFMSFGILTIRFSMVKTYNGHMDF
jgi:hypothetical protein